MYYIFLVFSKISQQMYIFFLTVIHLITCQWFIQKQTFNKNFYAFGSFTFSGLQLTNENNVTLQGYETFSQTFNNSNYWLVFGISQLNTEATLCKIAAQKSLSYMIINILLAPSTTTYKCSFNYLAVDQAQTNVRARWNVNINFTESVVNPSDPYNPYYVLAKPSSLRQVIDFSAATVEYFSSVQSTISFFLASSIINRTHVRITVGANHTLDELIISFIVADRLYLNFFSSENLQISNGKPSIIWNPNLLPKVIFMRGLYGSFPFNFDCQSTVCTIGAQSANQNSFKFLGLNLSLGICCWGTYTHNTTHCYCSPGTYVSTPTVCAGCHYSCKICNRSGSQGCLQCNPNHFRMITQQSSCTCITGYYDNKTSVCIQCMTKCLSCTNSSSCQGCALESNRNQSDLICSCLPGFFENNVAICPKCDPSCLTCTTTASNCLSCNSSLLRYLIGQTCVCQQNYSNIQGIDMCQKCPQGCLTCDQNFFCYSCENADLYSLDKGKCAQRILTTRMQIYRQKGNQITMQILFQFKVNFLETIEESLTVTVDGNITPFQIIHTSSQKIHFVFQLQNWSQNLTAQISISSISRASDNFPIHFEPFILNLEQIYFFNENEIKILKAVDNTFEAAVQWINYCRIGGVVFRLTNIFMDMIEYIHQISFYIYIDYKMPSNLKTVFSTLHQSLQYNLIPYKITLPGSQYSDFNQAQIFHKEGFTFNFINNSFVTIAQLIFVVIVYIYIGKVFQNSKSKSIIVQFIRKKYSPNIYSNCIQAFLAVHLPICFSSSVALIDRSFTHPMKLFNFSLGIFFLYIGGILPFLNPFILATIKNNKNINIDHCYANIKKQSGLSEYYLVSRAVLCFVVGVCIPLLSYKMALPFLLLACLFQFYWTIRAKFKSQIYRVIRLIFLGSNTLTHVLLVVLILPIHLSFIDAIKIGYTIIVFMILNITIDAVEIVMSFIFHISDFMKKNDKNPENSIVPIDKNQKKLIVIRGIFKSQKNKVNARRQRDSCNKKSVKFEIKDENQHTQDIIDLSTISQNNRLAIEKKEELFQKDSKQTQSRKKNRNMKSQFSKQSKLMLLFNDKPPQ